MTGEQNICNSFCGFRESEEKKVPVVHNKSCNMYTKSHKGHFKCWKCGQSYGTHKLLSLHSGGDSYITLYKKFVDLLFYYITRSLLQLRSFLLYRILSLHGFTNSQIYKNIIEQYLIK